MKLKNLKKKLVVASAVILSMSSSIVLSSVTNVSPITTSITASADQALCYTSLYATTSTKARVVYNVRPCDVVNVRNKFYANGDYWAYASVNGRTGYIRTVFITNKPVPPPMPY